MYYNKNYWVISKLSFGVVLPQPNELKSGKNHPPFAKGGQGDYITV
jgi:hypothetical protein